MIPVRIHEQRKLIIAPNTKGVATLVPHAKPFQFKGKSFVAVPVGRDEVQLMRNLGFDVPSTMKLDYDWGGNEPFRAQVFTTELLVHNPRAYVLNDMATGKTLSALFAFDYLKRKGLATRMLVVAPKSILTPVWAREVFARMPHLSCAVLWHSSSKQRRKLAADESDVLVINHHGLGVLKKELIARRDIDVVVFDELAVFRNKQTSLWKDANAVAQGRKFVWGMTGSPTPKEPTDAWAQCKLITPSSVPRYFKQFREMTMSQVSQFKWIPKRDANDVVFKAMQPAVRFTREDCVDIPPTTYSSREIDLSKEQKQAYDQLWKLNRAQFAEGDVTAVNEGVKMGKLLQVACGFAYTENRGVVDLKPGPRITETCDILDSTAHKVIIFVPFIQGVDMLFTTLASKGYDVERVYGDTPLSQRNEIFNRFQHTPKTKALVAHPQCMAHGLTLTAADTILWYSPPLSLEIYEQANARIPRPGQRNHTHIIQMVGTPVEQRVFKRLEKRASVQGALLEMFREESRSAA